MPRLGTEDTKEWLGYIRFLSRDGKGTIDISNRCATLQPRYLDLGGTTKTRDSGQAGVHGEGLKIALLVLMRGPQNHNIRCRSGGFNWNFNFTTRGRLVARLHRMSPESIQKAKEQSRQQKEKTLLPLAVEPARDVQFVIGEQYKGRDESGNMVKQIPVLREEFDEWTKAALFLHKAGDEGIVSTPHGDLLAHPELRGTIYLKGLLLSESTPGNSASITKLPLKFGYNFAEGNTNRERQSVASANKESRAILAIWSRVLFVRPPMVQELSSMLNDTEIEYADVFGAKRGMDLETESCLTEYLLGEEFAGKWYYCSEDKAKVRGDIQGLFWRH